MNKASARKRDVNAAIGSVRAEGLRPSLKTRKRLDAYTKGKISAQELRRVTVQEMRQNAPRASFAD